MNDWEPRFEAGTIPINDLDFTKQTLAIFKSTPGHKADVELNWLITPADAVIWKALDNQIRYRQALELWRDSLTVKRGKKR